MSTKASNWKIGRMCLNWAFCADDCLRTWGQRLLSYSLPWRSTCGTEPSKAVENTSHTMSWKDLIMNSRQGLFLSPCSDEVLSSTQASWINIWPKSSLPTPTWSVLAAVLSRLPVSGHVFLQVSPGALDESPPSAHCPVCHSPWAALWLRDSPSPSFSPHSSWPCPYPGWLTCCPISQDALAVP